MSYNLNLKKRIVLGYVLPLGLFVAVSFLVFATVQDLQRNFQLVQNAQSIVILTKDLQNSFLEMHRSVRGYMISKEERLLLTIDKARERYAEDRKALDLLVENDHQQARLGLIHGMGERLMARVDMEVGLVNNGKTSLALENSRSGKGTDLADELDRAFRDFEAHEVEILAQRVEAQREGLRYLVMLVIGATLLAVVLAVLIGIFVAGRISRTVSESIAGMSASTAQIAATVDEHERTVNLQAAAVNETTSTVEELGASSRQSASQAESTALAASQALAVAAEGTELANQVAESMAEMKAKVGDVADQILRLSEHAGQIGGIARVVGELASETNMLALNAAVEAARAGEHGRGFAVVASEVRKLAEQSKKSAERANTLVGEIQKATNSAVMVTDDGNRTAENVLALTQKALEAFDTIANAANRVSESAQQVLLNSKQQSIALEQVTIAMKSLSVGSMEIATGTQQTQVGVQKLNSVAIGLKALV